MLFRSEKINVGLTNRSTLENVFEGVELLLRFAGIYWFTNIICEVIQSIINIIKDHASDICAKCRNSVEEYKGFKSGISELAKNSNCKYITHIHTKMCGNRTDINICKCIMMVEKLNVNSILYDGKYYLSSIYFKKFSISYYKFFLKSIISRKSEYIISVKIIEYMERVQRLLNKINFNHEVASKDFKFNQCQFSDGVRENLFEYIKLDKK